VTIAMNVHGLSENDRAIVAEHTLAKPCPFCGVATWDVVGGEHLGYFSGHRVAASVRCRGCGFLALFDLSTAALRVFSGR
jgi:hypothetical protein